MRLLAARERVVGNGKMRPNHIAESSGNLKGGSWLSLPLFSYLHTLPQRSASPKRESKYP